MKTPAVLRQYEKMGRHGDSVLAHVMPSEIALLKAFGGSGTRNPKTGLLEFWGDGTGSGGAEGENGGDNSVGASGDNEANDGGSNVGTGAAPGTADAPAGVSINTEDMMTTDTARNIIARNMLRAVPGTTMAMGLAKVGGMVAEALGATNEAANAAISVVGNGGIGEAAGGMTGQDASGAAGTAPGAPGSPGTAATSLYAPVGPALVNYTPPAFRANVAAPNVLDSYSQQTQGQLPAIMQAYADQEARFRAATQTPITASIYQPGMWGA